MKKIFDKKTIITVILSGIFFSCLTVYAITTIYSKDVTFDTRISKTKSSDLQGALDELYERAKDNVCHVCEFDEGKTWDFDYTGSEQEFNVPCSGTYKLETWGASGASASGYNNYGYGGYSVGSIDLEYNERINLVVGSASTNAQGGYNGGGAGGTCGTEICYGGGGATHIARTTGKLSTLESNKDSIIMVSGAGGGSWGYSVTAGSAGGYMGLNATGQAAGIGGTQISAGSTGYCTNAGFGQGGSICVTHSSGCNCSGGGGAGYYGGSVGYVGTTSSGAGGGGSPYIGNSNLTNKAMYCYNCTESTDEGTKTVKTTCANTEPTEKCAKKGNGYARITLVSLK